LFDGLISLTNRFISARIGEGLIFDMRAKVFAHIQQMPIAFFMRTQTGALVSRLNNDIIGAQQAFTDLLSNMVGNVISVVVTLSLMFWLSWQVTIAALILLPLFLIPARRVGAKLGALTREAMNLNAKMNNTMQERFNVSGALLVKLFGDAANESSVFNRRAGRVRDIGVRTALYSRTFFIALGLTASLATAFAYGFGGVSVIHGTLQLGTVVALTAYLSRLFGPLTQLSNLNLDLMTALVSFERVFEVLDLTPMIEEAQDATDLPHGPLSVTFRNVSFTYPSAREVSLASLESVAVLEETQSAEVLHGIDLNVPAGTMLALVGPSGAGKSTISQLIPRLYDVSSGRVELGGVDVRAATFASLTEAIGVVSQDPHLFHDTLRANLLYAKPTATEAELRAALEQAQILPLIDLLPDGLETLVGERGYRLSGGEKQRIALARLLLKQPRIIVLDEATAHLDSESEAAVQQALSTTLQGRTSIVIAHRLSTIREADAIAVIDRGSVVELGTHEELLANGGLYADLYRTQFASQA
jgi:ATP-binding cassette subfamily B protein